MLRTVRHYIIVAVLGRLGRPSAIAAIEQQCVVGRDGRSAVDAMELKYLDVPKETGQAELASIVENLRAYLLPGDNSSGRVEVVLDVTESGRSIIDLMGDGPYPLTVSVGNGSAAAQRDDRGLGVVRLTRMGVAGVLDREMQRARFAMPPEVDAKLGPALRAFNELPPRQGADDLDYVRRGEADDVALAAAIACWRAAEFPSRLAGPGGEPEVISAYDETRYSGPGEAGWP